MAHPNQDALTIEQMTTVLGIELCVVGDSSGPLNRPIPPLASMIHTMLALRRMCLVGRPFNTKVMQVLTFDGRDSSEPKEVDDASSRRSQAQIPLRCFRAPEDAPLFKTLYCRSIQYHQPTESILFFSNEGLLMFWRNQKKKGQGFSSEVQRTGSLLGDGTGAVIVNGPQTSDNDTTTSSVSPSYQLVTVSYPAKLRIFDIVEPAIGEKPSLEQVNTTIDLKSSAFNCTSLFHICPRPWDHRRVILGDEGGIALFDLDKRQVVKSNLRFGPRIMGMCIVDEGSASSSLGTRFVACAANASLYFWSADFDEEIAIQNVPCTGEHMDVVSLPRSMRRESPTQSLNLLAVSDAAAGIRIFECPALCSARSAKNKERILELPSLVPLRTISDLGILPLCVCPWDIIEDWVEDDDEPL